MPILYQEQQITQDHFSGLPDSVLSTIAVLLQHQDHQQLNNRLLTNLRTVSRGFRTASDSNLSFLRVQISRLEHFSNFFHRFTHLQQVELQTPQAMAQPTTLAGIAALKNSFLSMRNITIGGQYEHLVKVPIVPQLLRPFAFLTAFDMTRVQQVGVRGVVHSLVFEEGDLQHVQRFVIKQCPDIHILDVSFLQQLSDLLVTGNPLLSVLTLSRTGLLRFLTCRDNTILQLIDLEGAPALESVFLQRNSQLAHTTFSGSTVQQIVSEHNSEQVQMNVHNCRQLQTAILHSLAIPYLSLIGTSGVTTLRLVGVGYLQDIVPIGSLPNLRSLLIKGSRMATLSLHAHHCIVDCSLLENLSMLSVDLSYSNVSVVTTSSNSRLRSLDLSSCAQLTNLSVKDELELEELSLDNSQHLQSVSLVSNDSLREVHLENQESLHSLVCTEMSLSDIDLSESGQLSQARFERCSAGCVTIRSIHCDLHVSQCRGTFDVDCLVEM